MIDLEFKLGRNVPTGLQVIDVIRPHLRVYQVFYAGLHQAMLRKELAHDEEYFLKHKEDDEVALAIKNAVVDLAFNSVREWAKNQSLVFDPARVIIFIEQALTSAEVINRDDFCPLGSKVFKY